MFPVIASIRFLSATFLLSNDVKEAGCLFETFKAKGVLDDFDVVVDDGVDEPV